MIQPDLYAHSPLLWAAKHGTVVHPQLGEIPFNPYPYQARLLADRSDRRIIVKPRQVGVSNALAIEAAHKALFTNKRTIIFISRNEKLAGEIKSYASATLNPLARSGYLDSLNVKITRDNTTDVALNNGSRILSLPANQDTARGIAGSDVYLDEQAFHMYADEIYQSVMGTISTGGNLTIISTPKGRNNKFARLWFGQEGGEEWSKHRISFREKPEYDAEWERKMRSAMTRAAFAEEFECDFVASGNPVFDRDDIQAMQDGSWMPPPYVAYVTAWDIGSRHDYAVGCTWGLSGATWNLIAFDRMRAPYTVLQHAIEKRYNDYEGAHLVESNGVGDPVIDNLLIPVKPFLTSNRSKANAVEKLKILSEKRRLKLPTETQREALSLSVTGCEQLMVEMDAYEYMDEKLIQDTVMSAAIASTEMDADIVEYVPYVDENNVPEFSLPGERF